MEFLEPREKGTWKGPPSHSLCGEGSQPKGILQEGPERIFTPPHPNLPRVLLTGQPAGIQKIQELTEAMPRSASPSPSQAGEG